MGNTGHAAEDEEYAGAVSSYTVRMWHRVTLVRTEVSEERIASIFRVETISELGATLAVT
jgi:hypothetical protein